jgi:hypothetical protein
MQEAAEEDCQEGGLDSIEFEGFPSVVPVGMLFQRDRARSHRLSSMKSRAADVIMRLFLRNARCAYQPLQAGDAFAYL